MMLPWIWWILVTPCWCLPTKNLATKLMQDSSCDYKLTPETKIWRGNQTHELFLPMKNEPLWEATADIQSGDILLVHINDVNLIINTNNVNKENKTTTTETVMTTTASSITAIVSSLTISSSEIDTMATVSESSVTTDIITSSSNLITSEDEMEFNTVTTELAQLVPQVYIVTRPAHDSCDVSDGVLLDSIPLIINEGNKILTLCDKDLTDGINLLIITSDEWGGKCIKLKIVVKSENCGESEDCSGKGACYTNASMEGYECQCCVGYIGPHCEEKDACYPSPCLNNGICVDLSQGHEGSTYQCLCPYGFIGKNCEDTSDPCESSPCHNGGQCVSSNQTAQQFRCICLPGFTGPFCKHNLGACTSSPCQHGICVDQHDGYRCFCQPGYTGSQCQEEYNECDSSPCFNGGTCIDHIDSYSCNCGRGYRGTRCQEKINLCDPNPCSHHYICLDKGNNYICVCPKGFTGPDCLIPTRAACTVNPCRNGGTCWSSGDVMDSFYCACRPGFTGRTCEEEVVIEVIPSSGDPMEIGDIDNGDDLEVPVTVHLDHLHNVYVAAGTLACAIFIVIITVVVCHCRMHETYKKCCLKKSPFFPCRLNKRIGSILKKNSHHKHLERDKEPLAPIPHHNANPFPGLDVDIYCTLDLSDSQSSPLIQ